MIRPAQAEAIERQLIMLARSGQLNRKLGDDELRSMLEQVSTILIDFELARDSLCQRLTLSHVLTVGLFSTQASSPSQTRFTDTLYRGHHSMFEQLFDTNRASIDMPFLIF